jgi:hypothetical protein
MVRHRLLLDKMSTDVGPCRCQLLDSYFSGRFQRLRMGDCVSSNILVTSGVPQGSHMGPLCFIWSSNLLSLISIIALWYHTRASDFLRVDFQCTNYGVHVPLNGAFQSFNEFTGLFNLYLSGNQIFTLHKNWMICVICYMCYMFDSISMMFL